MPDNDGVSLREEIAARLARRMEELKISNTALGEAIGVDDSTVSRWRAGQRSPHATHVHGICRQLGVSADWLIGLDEGYSQDSPAERLEVAEVLPQDEGEDRFRSDIRQIVREEIRRALEHHPQD